MAKRRITPKKAKPHTKMVVNSMDFFRAHGYDVKKAQKARQKIADKIAMEKAYKKHGGHSRFNPNTRNTPTNKPRS